MCLLIIININLNIKESLSIRIEIPFQLNYIQRKRLERKLANTSFRKMMQNCEIEV